MHKYSNQFKEVELFDINKIANDWDAADDKFFGEGKIFDQIYVPAKN